MRWKLVVFEPEVA